MARILVTGATGLLGTSLSRALVACGHSVIRHGYRSDADILADLCNLSETEGLLQKTTPECIVNLAALTNVDTCESHPNLAYQVNVLSVKNLCRSIRKNGGSSFLIHISTDHLYDGPGPHTEDSLCIRNYYAFSKLASESIAASVPSAIVRTNFFGRSQRAGRSSFSDWIYHGLKRGDSLPVFEDVFFSPLAIPTLCDMLEKVIRRRPVGTFNLGSKNGMSKADFAFYFAATTGLPKDKLLRTSSLESSGNKARRPLDMRMNCDLFEEAMQIKLPNLADELNLIRDFYVEQS